MIEIVPNLRMDALNFISVGSVLPFYAFNLISCSSIYVDGLILWLICSANRGISVLLDRKYLLKRHFGWLLP